MQFLQAGRHKLVLLELDRDFLGNIAKQAGFEHRVEETARNFVLELSVPERQNPLLLFDAADPSNLGWFSRCQFYVDGKTGAVLQTPLLLGNLRDRGGRIVPNAIRVQIAKELPSSFRMPGKQPVSEQVVYAVLFNFLNALQNVGVALCGGPLLKPLSGRLDAPGSRN